MTRCAYCGEKVGDEGLYVDDEVFCSDDCMRDFGAGGSSDDDDLDDDDDDDVEPDEDDDDDEDEEEKEAYSGY
jgi:hypothetical protein